MDGSMGSWLNAAMRQLYRGASQIPDCDSSGGEASSSTVMDNDESRNPSCTIISGEGTEDNDWVILSKPQPSCPPAAEASCSPLASCPPEEKATCGPQPFCPSQAEATCSPQPSCSSEARQRPVFPPLRLGPRASLVYLEDVSQWVGSMKGRVSCVPGASWSGELNGAELDPRTLNGADTERAPTTLSCAEIEAFQRLCNTITPGHYVKGIYKVQNCVFEAAYKEEADTQFGLMAEVYMYHGATLPALASIAHDGFDLSAGSGCILVSNRSDFSMIYPCSAFPFCRAQSDEARRKTTLREIQLLEKHERSKSGKAAAVPLISAPPAETHALLVCKVLVPWAMKDMYTNEYSWPSLVNYYTMVSDQVCPHFLVHVSALKA